MKKYILRLIRIIKYIKPINIVVQTNYKKFYCKKLYKFFINMDGDNRTFLVREYRFNINTDNLYYRYRELIEDIYYWTKLTSEVNDQSMIIFYYLNNKVEILYVNLKYSEISYPEYIKEIRTNFNRLNYSVHDRVNIRKIYVIHLSPEKDDV